MSDTTKPKHTYFAGLLATETPYLAAGLLNFFGAKKENKKREEVF